jgi:DNA-binding FadR family transcriptional regulator
VEQLAVRGLVVESKGSGGKYKNYTVFDIGDDDIAELFVARKAIESTAAFVCAQKNWYVDMPLLEQSLEDFRLGMKDYVDGGSVRVATEHDRKFHTAIVESSRNRYLRDMYESLDKKLNYLSTRTCEFMAAGLRRDDLMMLCSQHSSVVQAIKMGFPELARQAMDDHIDFCAGNCLNNRYLSEIKK